MRVGTWASRAEWSCHAARVKKGCPRGNAAARRYLEEELARRYRDAAPATLALLQGRCAELAGELAAAQARVAAVQDVASLRGEGAHARAHRPNPMLPTMAVILSLDQPQVAGRCSLASHHTCGRLKVTWGTKACIARCSAQQPACMIRWDDTPTHMVCWPSPAQP
jgi:hypothetical protein